MTEIMHQKDGVAFVEMLNQMWMKSQKSCLKQSFAVTNLSLNQHTVQLHVFIHLIKKVDTHNSATLTELHYHIIKTYDCKKEPKYF